MSAVVGEEGHPSDHTASGEDADQDTKLHASDEEQSNHSSHSFAETPVDDKVVENKLSNFQLGSDEVLSPPPGERPRSEVGFGNNGTAAYISEYGELLIMRKFLGKGVADTGMVMATPKMTYWELSTELWKRMDENGKGIGLRPIDSYCNISQLQLAFVHDRWPRVSFVLPNLARVTIQYIVQHGCIFQQYVVEGLSDNPETELEFILDLEIGLLPVISRYLAYDTYSSGLEIVLSPTGLSVQVKAKPETDYPDLPDVGEFMLDCAVFENGKAVDLFSDPNTHSPYTWHDIKLVKGRKRELMAKYYLKALHSSMNEPMVDIEEYFDVCSFLQEEIHGAWKWDLSGPKDSPYVFRRYLEHILSVCLVPVKPYGTEPMPIVLTDGEIIEPQQCCKAEAFLLMMYKVVERAVEDTIFREYLQKRIKTACIGLLEWYFNVAEVDQFGWHDDYQPTGVPCGSDNDFRQFSGVDFLEVYVGALSISPEEIPSLARLIEKPRVMNWLKGIEQQRNPKSKLWVSREKIQPVDWFDRDYGGDDQISLSHYRLIDMACHWRDLRFLQAICENRRPRTNPQGQSNPQKAAESSASSLQAARLGEHMPALSDRRRSAVSITSNSDQRDRVIKGLGGKLSEAGDTGVEDFFDAINRNISEECRINMKEIINRLDPIGLRHKIIERFTFKPQLPGISSGRGVKARIAMCRSATAQIPRTRFHHSDASLFNAVEWGFFDDEVTGSLLPAWVETCLDQDDTDKDWEYPLRYAIALRLAYHNLSHKQNDGALRIGESPTMEKDGGGMTQGQDASLLTRSIENKRIDKETATILNRFRQIIMSSVLANGLFANELDIYKKPLRATEYPHSRAYMRFNCACVLLRIDFPEFVSKGINEKYPTIGTEIPQIDNGEYRKEIRRIRKARDGRLPKMLQTEQKRTVEYSQPEWLYNDPPFFPGRGGVNISDIPPVIADSLLPENLRQRLSTIKGGHLSSAKDLKAMAINVHRDVELKPTTNSRDRWRKRDILSVSRLNSFLQKERTREKAKKQLIMLDDGNVDAILLLYLRCPQSEKNSMVNFLDRHAKFSNTASEITNRLANLWITEFHITFYRVHSGRFDEHQKHKFVHCSSEMSLKGRSESLLTLVKATQGFRMVGDMYDRFWSCWILSRVPGSTPVTVANPEPLVQEFSSDDSLISSFDPPDQHLWHAWMSDTRDGFHAQRRILELRIFAKMAKDTFKSTDDILESIETYISREVSDASNVNTNTALITISKHNLDAYSQIIYVLKRIQRNAEAVRTAAKDWEDRTSEKENPEKDKPRWSVSDELKYGTILNYELRRSRRIIGELREQEERIRNKISEVERSTESTRAELSVNLSIVQSQTDENVRLFTYATVIFLPLGFSSSLFSMGGSPSSPTIKAFAVTVVVTLAGTAMILLNMKPLAKILGATGKGFSVISKPISTWWTAAPGNAETRMAASGRRFWAEKARTMEKRRSKPADEYVPITSQQSKNTYAPAAPSRIWYTVFWMYYVSLELPAIWIARAMEVIPAIRRRYPPAHALKPSKGGTVNDGTVEGGNSRNGSIITHGDTSSVDSISTARRRESLNQQGDKGTARVQESGDSGSSSHPAQLPAHRQVSHVFAGLAVLPLFVISHFILFIGWNITDLATLIFTKPRSDQKKKDETSGEKPDDTVQNPAELRSLSEALSCPLRLKSLMRKFYKPSMSQLDTTAVAPPPPHTPVPAISLRRSRSDIEAQE